MCIYNFFYFSVKSSHSTLNNEKQSLSPEQELARLRRLKMFGNVKNQSSSS